jgi:hypothetical protein
MKFIPLTNWFLFGGNHKYFIYAEKIRNLLHQGEGGHHYEDSVSSRCLQATNVVHVEVFYVCLRTAWCCEHLSFKGYHISKLGTSILWSFIWTSRHRYYKSVIIPATVEDRSVYMYIYIFPLNSLHIHNIVHIITFVISKIHFKLTNTVYSVMSQQIHKWSTIYYITRFNVPIFFDATAPSSGGSCQFPAKLYKHFNAEFIFLKLYICVVVKI